MLQEKKNFNDLEALFGPMDTEDLNKYKSIAFDSIKKMEDATLSTLAEKIEPEFHRLDENTQKLLFFFVLKNDANVRKKFFGQQPQFITQFFLSGLKIICKKSLFLEFEDADFMSILKEFYDEIIVENLSKPNV